MIGEAKMNTLGRLYHEIKKRVSANAPREDIVSLYEEYVRELKRETASRSHVRSDVEHANDVLSIIKNLKERLSHNVRYRMSSRPLEQWERRLRLLDPTANKAEIQAIERDLYALVDGTSDLRQIYDEVIEQEIIDILSSKLACLEQISKRRALSREEQKQVRMLKSQQKKTLSIRRTPSL